MALIDILPIVEQIADALDTAHEAGIYHRDLKPDNIYLAVERNGPPSVRILDFGIAKLVESDVSATQTGVQMGTPLFMSPEQWEGRGVDHRTDIYALGVLVHHLITGRYPFESTSHVALMNLHVNGEPNLPSAFGADEALDGLFAKALAKGKEYRFGTAQTFYQELVSAAVGADVSSPMPQVAVASIPTQFSEVERRSLVSSRRRRLVLFGVAGVGVAAAALAFAMTRGGDPTTKPSLVDEPATATVDAAVEVGAVALHPDAGAAPAAVVEIDAGPKQTLPPKKRQRDGKPIKDSLPDTNNKKPEVKPPPKKPGDKPRWGDTVDPYQ